MGNDVKFRPVRVDNMYLTRESVDEALAELRMLAQLANVGLVDAMTPCQKIAYTILKEELECS